MAGQVTFGQLQIGDDATATKNFVLKVPASPDGTIALYRGNYGAESQTIFSVANTTGAFGVTNLLDLSGAAAGQIKFPVSQNASTDANTLDDYDEYTAASAACGGAITTAVVWKLVKIGKQVTLTLPVTTGNGSGSSAVITYGVSIPAKYRPAANMTFPVNVLDNGARQTQVGLVYIIASSGGIELYRSNNTSTAWTNGGTDGIMESVSFSWMI